MKNFMIVYTYENGVSSDFAHLQRQSRQDCLEYACRHTRDQTNSENPIAIAECYDDGATEPFATTDGWSYQYLNDDED